MKEVYTILRRIIVLAVFLIILIPSTLNAESVSIVYRNPREFSSYWSFEPFKPLPPRDVEPVVVKIFENREFATTGYTPISTVIDIPPGSYGRAILNVSLRLTDRQYDRILWIFANGIPIWWGSTVQRLNSTAEADVTLFLNLFRGRVNFSMVLANWVVPNIAPGVFIVNVTLYLYPGPTPRWVPTDYIPLFRDPNGNSLAEFTPDRTTINTSVSLPEGSYRVAAYLFTKPGRLDEFFYANIPSVRDILVYYNERLSGVFHVFPVIYTGGIFPLYWRPMTSVNTHYTKSPEIIDLTPNLVDGLNANLSLRIVGVKEASYRASSPYFSVIIGGALLVWRDPSVRIFGGSLISSEAWYNTSRSIIDVGDRSYYTEVARYRISYTARLNTSSGILNISTLSTGYTISTILSGSDFTNLTLLQSFINYATSPGSGSIERFLERQIGTWYIDLRSIYKEILVSPTREIPYEEDLVETDLITVTQTTMMRFRVGDDCYREDISESVYVEGGFSVRLRVIDPYGGAVIIGLSSAQSTTRKTLDATILYNFQGYRERFNIVTEASLAKIFGDFKEFYIEYMLVP
ncbi:MAG: peptide-N4-asparagine amidase [Sulfolobales archaeon]